MARRRRSNSKTAKRKAAKEAGFASGYELDIAEHLEAMGVEYEYEAQTFQWQDKVPGAVCPECGTRAEATRSYTPDWFLANGIIIESKGRFTANDRKIALAMRDQGIVIHYLFALNNKLSPKSKTRYTDWCESKGLPCAIGMPPDEWLVEE